MQNPPAYVQVDAAGQSSRPNFQYSPLYTRISPSRDNDHMSGMPNILLPSPLSGSGSSSHHIHHHHHHHNHNHHAAAVMNAANAAAAEANASRLQQLHSRLTGPYGTPSPGLGRKPMPNAGLVPPGLPNFPSGGHHHHHQSRSLGFDHHHLSPAPSGSANHSPNLSEAFVNSFGLSSSAFLNPYSFADRARTPSPLHRFLHSQLLGGQYHGGGGGPGGGNGGSIGNDHHFAQDDLLLDNGTFRGLNLSTSFAPEERHHGDPLMSSGHLSRSLDDLSVVLDNSNESADLSMRHRNESSSPDDTYKNDFTQSSSENTTNSNPPSRSASTHSKVMPTSSSHGNNRPRRLGNSSRADISRTCPTCGKTFGNSSGLAKHRLTHSDERKYLCQICMKSFKRQDHLSGHLLTHSEKKPFACPVENCGKSYCDSRSLKRHLDQHESWMIPDNVRLMFSESNTPDDTEDTVSSLDNQEVQTFSRGAEQLRPFACQICRRRFKNGPALNGHMRLHGGFFSKKGGGDYSAPPSVQTSSINMDYSSAVQSPVDMMDPSDHDDSSRHGQDMMHEGGEWNDPDLQSPVPSVHSYHRSDSLDNNSLNHVAVIRHVPPAIAVLKASALPPVASLASPSNSPNSHSASFSFQYPVHSPPLSAPQSVMPQNNGNNSAVTLTVPPITGKHRRHSDSDNMVPAKRPCTVTDMLRHTVNLNIARKTIGDSSPRSEGNHTGMQHEMPITVAQSFSASFDQRLTTSSGLSLHNQSADDLHHSGRTTRNEENSEFHDPTIVNHSPTSDFRSADSPMSLVGSLTSGSDAEYPDSPFGSSDPGSSKKLRRKHRPEPLIIPPHGGNAGPADANSILSPGAGFPSMLRSPRWPNPEGTKSGCTPPPYTPPPMLSPTRRGSGLFWNVITSTGNVGNATPQSGSRFLLKRSFSNSSSHLEHRNSLSGLIGEDPVESLTESPFTFTPLVPAAPETDSNPHINIGCGHQADLPEFIGFSDDTFRVPVREDPVWIPGVAAGLNDRDLDVFASFAGSSALPKGGQNAELAHHVLFHSAGEILRALKVLMIKDELINFVSRHPALRTYHYQNSDVWTPQDITEFTNALMKHDKDFFLVAQEMTSKDIRKCVEFYYNWKKILPDEYRRVKATRRRRQQDLVTRSKSAAALQAQQKVEGTVPDPVVKVPVTSDLVASYLCPFAGCGNAFGTKQALSAHSRVHLSRGNPRIPASLVACPPPLPVLSVDDDTIKYETNGMNSQFPFSAAGEPAGSDFPCKLCGKRFNGIKSRNAHMKVHSKAENVPVNVMDR